LKRRSKAAKGSLNGLDSPLSFWHKSTHYERRAVQADPERVMRKILEHYNVKREEIFRGLSTLDPGRPPDQSVTPWVL